eukprot:105789_1
MSLLLPSQNNLDDWVMVQDPNSGKMYYVNLKTNETRWTPPPSPPPPKTSQSFHDEEIKNDHESQSIVPKSTQRIRSIPQIKSYLEHFIPELSFATTIKCFFLKPISICANIYFIIYQFYYNIFTDAVAHESVYQNHILEICKKIVVLIEFCGLIFLFLCIIITYLKSRYAELIDCVRLCGSWSTFQLFYKFQPLSLISYLSIILNHHEKRLEDNDAKIERLENLQHDLNFEMKEQTNLFGIDNDKIKDASTHLNFLIEIYKSKDSNEFIEKLKNNKFERMTAQKQSALRHHTSMGSTVAAFIEWTPKDYHAFFDRMIHLSSWFVCIMLLTFLLTIGLMSFLLKLSMFGFISSKPINEWDFIAQFLPFLLFCNQVWNVINIDAIRVESVYKFLFINSNVSNNRYVSQRMGLLDSIIKIGLWKGFGYRGLLIAISLNAEIVQKIIVKQSTELSTLQLIQYKATLKDRHTMDKDSHFFMSLKKQSGLNTFNLDDSIDRNHRVESISDDNFFEKDVENINEENIKNIIIKKEFDENFDWWDKVKNKIKQKLLQYADWLTMSYKRQPNHPYTSVRTEIDNYYNSLDSMSDKVLVNIRSRRIDAYSVYNEYKLAVKSIKDDTTVEDNEDDIGSTITVYNPTDNADWTMVRVTRSISKLIVRNKSKSASRGIEMDSFHSMDDTKKRTKYYRIYENTFVHKIVLFERLERYISFFAPFAMAIFACAALLATMISIIIYPNGIKDGTDHGCIDSEVDVIIQMRHLNMAFMICCLIGIIYLGIFRYLTRIQAKDEVIGLRNCFKIGSHRHFLRISSIMGLFMWIILAVLCWIRFIDFVRLQYQCKQHVIHDQSVLFISIIGNGVFAIFMTIITWITLLSYVWLALIVFFMGMHLCLLYFFYVLGWNFTVHSITEFILLFNTDIIEEHEFEDHCRIRFIFVAIIFFSFCIYLIIGIMELYYSIKRSNLEGNAKILNKKKIHDQPSDNLLDESESSSKKYFVQLNKGAPIKAVKKSNLPNLLKHNKYENKFKCTRRIRIVIISIMYLCAVVHYIIADIIDEIIGDITDACENSHFAIIDGATYYSKKMENLFIFAMFLDVILFGKLFKSWKIIMDPIFWLSRYIYHKTHKTVYCLLTLVITATVLCVMSVLFMKHDLEVFD